MSQQSGAESSKSGAERRAYARLPLYLDASVNRKGQPPHPCKIRDFCLGGMFLGWEENGPPAGPPLVRSDAVEIHFEVPILGSRKKFWLRARVARGFESGLGVAFTNPESALLRVLEDFASRNQLQAPPAQPEAEQSTEETSRDDAPADKDADDADTTTRARLSIDASRILRSCHDVTQEHLEKRVDAFLERVDQSLMLSARDSTNNTEQAQFFDAITELNEQKAAIKSQVCDPILEQLQGLDSAPKAQPDTPQALELDGELALVDQNEFEDWLVAKEMVTRAEARYSEALFEIQARFSRLVRTDVEEQNNPVGPAAICHTFHESVRSLQAGPLAKSVVYGAFEDSVVSDLAPLYEELNDLLKKSGVLPGLERGKPTVARAPAGAAGPAPAASVADEPLDPTEVPVPDAMPPQYHPGAGHPGAAAGNLGVHPGAAYGAAPDAPAAVAAHGAPAGPAAGFQEWQPGMPVAPVPGVAPLIPGAPPPVAYGGQPMATARSRNELMSDAYRTARELLSLQRQVQYADLEQDITDTSTGLHLPSVALQTYNPNEILGALSRLQGSTAQDLENAPTLKLRRLLMDELSDASSGGEAKRIGNNESDAIEVVENLIGSMLEDEHVPDQIKPSIKRMHAPMLRSALLDENFLQSNDHPVRRVVNQLARLGSAVGDEPTQTSQVLISKIDELIERINKGFDRDLDVFSDALQELDPMVEDRDREYSENIEKVVEACEDQQALVSARRSVSQEIDKRIGGKRIPKAALLLLDAGWRELLNRTYIQHGPKSDQWRDYLHVVDSLILRMGEHRNTAAAKKLSLDPPALLQLINKGFDEAPCNEAQLNEALDEVEAVLVPKKGDAREPTFINVPPGAGHAGDAGPRGPTAAEKKAAAQPEWRQWLDRAKRLQVGDPMLFKSRGKPDKRLTLAWVGKDHSSFVFVDAAGNKAETLSQQELAMYMRRGTAELTDKPDLPVVDRAQQTMLAKMHEQLAHAATHDPLTGLFNRKEFERNLERALIDAKRGETEHVLCALNLDQFKIINNAGGHDAGDKLLKDIAQMLGNGLGEEVVLARLGGDEFGVLLKNRSQQEARALIEQQRAAIQNLTFEWEGKKFTLGASVGLVGVSSDNVESVSDLLKAADSATELAKRAGRNRIQIYEPDHAEIAHRAGVMEWVAKIDRALEQDLLHLRCQRIAPIFPENGARPHYEVLLGVMDDEGRTVSPVDFIEAAEIYDRMTQVDRWVIKTVFNWMADNLGVLAELGGFAINLSGQSLNDPALKDYVLEQFEASGAPKEYVCFEVTETAGIANLAGAASFIQEMKAIGCEFSLDDFGSGHSSYSYLKTLPVDYLKIDGIFVKDLTNSPSDYAVVKSINEIGHFMGKKTIAEYVENDDILQALREIGVDYAQGYGVEKPRHLTDLA